MFCAGVSRFTHKGRTAVKNIAIQPPGVMQVTQKNLLTSAHTENPGIQRMQNRMDLKKSNNY